MLNYNRTGRYSDLISELILSSSLNSNRTAVLNEFEKYYKTNILTICICQMQTCQPWELTKQHKNNLKIKIHGKLAEKKQRSLELHFSTLTNKALWFPCRNWLKRNNFIRICLFRKMFSGEQL